MPFMRVGRLVIYGNSLKPFKSLTEHQVMLHRMLIAVLTFQTFLKITSETFILSKVLVSIIQFLSLRYWRSSNKVLEIWCALRCQGIPTSWCSFSRIRLYIDYFPKFKGYTRLAPSSLVENMQRIGTRIMTNSCNYRIRLFRSWWVL